MGELVVKGDMDEVRHRMEKVVLSVPDESCSKGSVCPVLGSALKELKQLCIQYKENFAHHICRSTKARTVFNAGIHSTKPSIIYNAACIMAAAVDDADLPWSTSPHHSLADRFTELLNISRFEAKTVSQVCIGIAQIADDGKDEPRQTLARRRDFRHKLIEAGAVEALVSLMVPPKKPSVEDAPLLGSVMGVCAVEAASALIFLIRQTNISFNYPGLEYKLSQPDVLSVLVEMIAMDDTEAQFVGLSGIETLVGVSKEAAVAVKKNGGWIAAERVATMHKGWKFEKNGDTAQTIAARILQALRNVGLRVGQGNVLKKDRVKNMEGSFYCQCGRPLDLGVQGKCMNALRSTEWLLLSQLSVRSLNKFTYSELKRFVEAFGGACGKNAAKGKGLSRKELLDEALKIRLKQQDSLLRKSFEEPFLLDAWSSSTQSFLSSDNSRRHFQGENNEMGDFRTCQRGDHLHRGVSMLDMDGRPVSDDEMGDGLSQTLRDLIRAMSIDEDAAGEDSEELDKLHAHDAIGTLVQLPTLSPQSEARMRGLRTLCALRSGAKQLLLRSSPVPFLTLMEQATDEERQGLSNAGYLKCLCSMVTKGREDYAVTAMRSLSLFCRSGCLVGNTSGVDGVVIIDPVVDLLLDGSDEANLPSSDVHYACINLLTDLLTHPVDLFHSINARMTRLTGSHMEDADKVVAVANYLLRRGVPQRVQFILFLTTTGDGAAPRSSQRDGPWPMAHTCLRLLRNCLSSRKANAVLAELDRIFDSLAVWLEHATECPDAAAQACQIYAELLSIPSFMAQINGRQRFLTILHEFAMQSITMFECASVHICAQGIFIGTAKYLARAGAAGVDVTPQTVQGLCNALAVARAPFIYDSWLAVELLYNHNFMTVKQLKHLWPAVGDALHHLGEEKQSLSTLSDEQIKGFTVICRGLVRMLRCSEDCEKESDGEKNIRFNLNSAGPLPTEDRKVAIEQLLNSKITTSLSHFFSDKLAHLAFDVLRAMIGCPAPSWPPGRMILNDQPLLNLWLQVLLDSKHRESGSPQAWDIAVDGLRKLFMANPEAPRKVVPRIVEDVNIRESTVKYVYERNALLVNPLNFTLVETFVSTELALEPTSVLRYRGQRNGLPPQVLHPSVTSRESIQTTFKPLSAGSPFHFSLTGSSVIDSLPSSPLPTASAMSHSSRIAPLPIPHPATPTPCPAGTLAASPPAETIRTSATPTSNLTMATLAACHCELEPMRPPCLTRDADHQQLLSGMEVDSHWQEVSDGYILLPPAPEDKYAVLSTSTGLGETQADTILGPLGVEFKSQSPACDGLCVSGGAADAWCAHESGGDIVHVNGMERAVSPAEREAEFCSGVPCLDKFSRFGNHKSGNQYGCIALVDGHHKVESTVANGILHGVGNGESVLVTDTWDVCGLKDQGAGECDVSQGGGVELRNHNLTTNRAGRSQEQTDESVGRKQWGATLCDGMCAGMQCSSQKLPGNNTSGNLADEMVKESEWSSVISAGADDDANTDTDSFNSALGEDEAAVWADGLECTPEPDCSSDRELEPLVPGPYLLSRLECDTPVLTSRALSVAPLGDRQNASLSMSKVNGWGAEEAHCLGTDRGVAVVDVTNVEALSLVHGDTGDAEKENMLNAYQERMMRKTLEDLGSMLSRTCKASGEEAWATAIEEGVLCNGSLDDADGTTGVETSDKQHCHGCYGCGRTSSQALRKCSRCRKVDYCSVECQKKDWRNHKSACGCRNMK